MGLASKSVETKIFLTNPKCTSQSLFKMTRALMGRSYSSVSYKCIYILLLITDGSLLLIYLIS